MGKIQASANIVTINPESTIKLVFLKSMFTKITFFFLEKFKERKLYFCNIMSEVKIAYLSSSNPYDKKSWSGIHYHLLKTIVNQGYEVEYLGEVDASIPIFFGKLKSLLTKIFLRKQYDYRHSVSLSKHYAKHYNKKLVEKHYDLIFAPVASCEIAYIKTKIPIVSLSDTTFSNMINYYSNYTKLTKKSLKQALLIEQKALSNSAAIIYPSAWAKNSAITDFKIPSEKIKIIPLGANLENIPSAEIVLNKPQSSTCRLLFLGVDWERKGGQIAFETFLELKKMNIETSLVICGCIPPDQIKNENLQIIPFLDKNNIDDQQKLNDLLLNTDFLILPTKAECFGVVFCEASAFGIPSVTCDTGGVEGAVKNGINGYRLHMNASGLDFANQIASIFQEKSNFENLRESCRSIYEKNLNWDSWGSKAKEVFDEVLLG